MEHGVENPALTLAIALAAGMIGQALARHLRVPGIVILLALGGLLGPDGADLVRPDALGGGLLTLVGFAVAVILFDGGLNLNVADLLQQATVIRRMVTIGALVTTALGGLAAWQLMGWGWRTALLFGALVSVTGPTVITPLLRRIHLKRNISTILEAEGVFLDAIGAILAVAALEAALSPPAESVGEGVLVFVSRLGVGAALGLAGGLVITALLRADGLVPAGMENTLTLSLVLVMYQGCNAVFPESGIVAAPIAGVVVGNASRRLLRELLDFKEQLTMMFIGLLFVLLAADVRIEGIAALGWPGVLTVVALMVVVRPLSVAASTAGSDLTGRERAFLAWLAPRGIVAAAVASLFAAQLREAGIPGAEEFRALVFLVIAVTVVVQGLSGGQVARLLGVRRGTNNGFVILGANALGLAIGRALRTHGERIVFIDSNPGATHAAEEDGFRALWGNPLEERIQLHADLEIRRAAIAVTPNTELNLLFLADARREHRLTGNFIALPPSDPALREDLAGEQSGQVLFDGPRDYELWISRLGRKRAVVETMRRVGPGAGEPFLVPRAASEMILPLVFVRGERATPIGSNYRPAVDDVVYFALHEPDAAAARAWLAEQGWESPGTPATGDG